MKKIKIENFLDESPMFIFHELGEKLFIPFQNELKKHGVTFLQSLMLTALYFENSTVYPKDLAEALKTSRANISQIVSKLVRLGYVIKTKSQRDERRVDLALSPLGESLALKLIAIHEKRQQHLEGLLSIEEIFMLKKIYEKLQKQSLF